MRRVGRQVYGRCLVLEALSAFRILYVDLRSRCDDGFGKVVEKVASERGIRKEEALVVVQRSTVLRRRKTKNRRITDGHRKDKMGEAEDIVEENDVKISVKDILLWPLQEEEVRDLVGQINSAKTDLLFLLVTSKASTTVVADVSPVVLNAVMRALKSARDYGWVLEAGGEEEEDEWGIFNGHAGSRRKRGGKGKGGKKRRREARNEVDEIPPRYKGNGDDCDGGEEDEEMVGGGFNAAIEMMGAADLVGAEESKPSTSREPPSAQISLKPRVKRKEQKSPGRPKNRPPTRFSDSCFSSSSSPNGDDTGGSHPQRIPRRDVGSAASAVTHNHDGHDDGDGRRGSKGALGVVGNCFITVIRCPYDVITVCFHRQESGSPKSDFAPAQEQLAQLPSMGGPAATGPWQLPNPGGRNGRGGQGFSSGGAAVQQGSQRVDIDDNVSGRLQTKQLENQRREEEEEEEEEERQRVEQRIASHSMDPAIMEEEYHRFPPPIPTRDFLHYEPQEDEILACEQGAEEVVGRLEKGNEEIGAAINAARRKRRLGLGGVRFGGGRRGKKDQDQGGRGGTGVLNRITGAWDTGDVVPGDKKEEEKTGKENDDEETSKARDSWGNTGSQMGPAIDMVGEESGGGLNYSPVSSVAGSSPNVADGGLELQVEYPTSPRWDGGDSDSESEGAKEDGNRDDIAHVSSGELLARELMAAVDRFEEDGEVKKMVHQELERRRRGEGGAGREG
ncbi:hypothetical protein MKZ38_007614 [Zalerion maritima]|uniref:Uncharacterized protein n=1 Tax=Zalerion maritima TaxID=339359 RepID=A0AAD5S0K0_9PEZI|nr:hypothetical protein MKZ38_007614 [Zalerion maritima]